MAPPDEFGAVEVMGAAYDRTLDDILIVYRDTLGLHFEMRVNVRTLEQRGPAIPLVGPLGTTFSEDSITSVEIDQATGFVTYFWTCRNVLTGELSGCALRKGPDGVPQEVQLDKWDGKDTAFWVAISLPDGEIVMVNAKDPDFDPRLQVAVRDGDDLTLEKWVAEYEFPEDVLAIQEMVAETGPDGKTVYVVVTHDSRCSEGQSTHVGDCPFGPDSDAGQSTARAGTERGMHGPQCKWQRVTPCNQRQGPFALRGVDLAYTPWADAYMLVGEMVRLADQLTLWWKLSFPPHLLFGPGAASGSEASSATAARLSTRADDFDFTLFGGHSPAIVGLYADPGHGGGTFPGDFAIAYRDQGESGEEETFLFTPQVPCVDGPRSFCLNQDGYRVSARWRTRKGEIGAGKTVELTDDSGYLWFFDDANVETVVKVLEGCGVTGHRWVFAAGLTDVETYLTVQEMATGLAREYVNPQQTKFQPIQDTQAFPCSQAAIGAALAEGVPAGLLELETELVRRVTSARESAGWTAASAGGMAGTSSPPIAAAGSARSGSGPFLGAWAPAGAGGCAGDGALCLNADRFRVETAYRTSGGAVGAGHPTALTADTGYFWFFDQSNVEAVVKVLNGCGITGHYWVFAAGLTDVEVELTVTDTATGARRSYLNPLKAPFQPIQDTAAFPCG